MLKRIAFAALLALAPALHVNAQEAAPASIALSGTETATTLTRDALSSLPSVTQDVRFQTSKGIQGGRFTGVSLWAVLDRAGLLKAEGHNDALRRVFEVRGRDGYAILFSVGEIAPDFGNTPIILALSLDGKPLPASDGIRLIVPGDAKGARNVRDVVSITVR